MKKTGFLYDPRYLLHDTGPYHPEVPERLEAIYQGIEEAGLLPNLVQIQGERADLRWIETVHDVDYIRRFEEVCYAGRKTMDTPDCAMCSDTFETALLASGGVIKAVEMLMQGEIDNAFCAVRPPGHHAETGEAMGFCYFNNVAIAARYLRQQWSIDKVGIIDFDVHHGNGTDAIFDDDDRVLFCSLFQEGIFPLVDGQSTCRNGVYVPLPAGSGGEEMRSAIEKTWLPALEEFRPQMIFVSAGFDAHSLDDMSDLAFSDADFQWFTELVLEQANRHCSGRLVSVLEGGYELDSLARCVAAHVKTLSRL